MAAMPLSFSEQPRIVKIGFLGGLTGEYSEIAHHMIDGARIGLDECNRKVANRSVKLELLVENDGLCDPNRTMTAVHKFVSLDRVDAIMVWAYSAAQTIRSALGKRSVPVIFLWDSNPGIATMGANFYGTGPDAELASKKIVEDLSRDRMRRFGILAMTDEWVERVRGVLNDAANEKELQVAFDESLAPGVNDYRGTILRAKQRSADALVVLGYSSSLVALLKQVRQVWPSVRIYTIGQPAHDLQHLGEAAEGTVVVNGWITGELAKKLRCVEGCASETGRYRESPTDLAYAAYGYQSAVVVCSAVNRILDEGTSVTSTTLNEALRSISVNIGLGVVAPGRYTHIGESLLVWRNGKFVEK